MLKTNTYKVEGISPLMPKNGQTADPLNPFAQAMKKISGKEQCSPT